MRNYKNYLSELINSGRLDINLIVAVPRSCSTLLEASLSMNPGITSTCHEPSDQLKQRGCTEDSVYKRIFKCAKGDALDFNHDKHENVVIKEMAHRLGDGQLFQDYCDLIYTPPIFLIRNPLLSMESRLKKVVQALSIKPEPSLVDYLYELYGLKKPEKNGGNTNEIMGIQSALLDYYAQMNGSANWKELVNISNENRDYTLFEDLLKTDGIFELSRSGWQAMAQQVGYFKRQGREYIMMDSSNLLTDPELSLHNICDRWNLEYDERMVNWGERLTCFRTKQDEPYQQIWYDKILTSTGIRPLNRIPVDPSKFPHKISGYLKEIALPYYSQFSGECTFLMQPEGNVLKEREY